MSAKKVYVCYGYWETPDMDNSRVIKVSTNEDTIQNALEEIRKTRASEYVGERNDVREESISDMYYFITGEEWFAKFYITEELVED